MEALLNATHTRFSSVNISRHLFKKFPEVQQRETADNLLVSWVRHVLTNHQEAQHVIASSHLLASNAAFSCHTAQKTDAFLYKQPS